MPVTDFMAASFVIPRPYTSQAFARHKRNSRHEMLQRN